jgi:hypothetical protein
VGDEEHGHRPSKTDRLPSPFSGHGTILLKQSVGVLKDVLRVIETNAMFSLVRPRFHGIPFEPNHPAADEYSNNFVATKKSVFYTAFQVFSCCR